MFGSQVHGPSGHRRDHVLGGEERHERPEIVAKRDAEEGHRSRLDRQQRGPPEEESPQRTERLFEVVILPARLRKHRSQFGVAQCAGHGDQASRDPEEQHQRGMGTSRGTKAAATKIAEPRMVPAVIVVTSHNPSILARAGGSGPPVRLSSTAGGMLTSLRVAMAGAVRSEASMCVPGGRANCAVSIGQTRNDGRLACTLILPFVERARRGDGNTLFRKAANLAGRSCQRMNRST